MFGKRVFVSMVVAIIAVAPADIPLHAESGGVTGTGVDITKLSPDELMEFYKKNKDYGKQRIGLDYSKYTEGDWVVFRGEYTDRDSGKPISNMKVVFSVEGKEYISVTNELGVFNLEIRKKDIVASKPNKIFIYIDHFSISGELKGEDLIKNSIYHFAIDRIKKNDQAFGLSFRTIHNQFLNDGEGGFVYQEDIIMVPSIIGIQGIPLIILCAIIGLFLYFLYFRWRLSVSEKKVIGRKNMTPPRDPVE